MKRDRKAKNELDTETLRRFLETGGAEEACPVIYEDDKEENTMTKTLKVDGMMCEHCEMRVKKALEAVDGVVEAKADKDAKTAVVTLEKEVPFEVLKAAVEAQDYQVLGEA